MEETNSEIISAIASAMGKLSQKKHPRSAEYLAEIGRKGGLKRAENARKKKELNAIDSVADVR